MTLDGQPVHAFAIVLSKDPAYGVMNSEPPIVVSTTDGRFSVDAPVGTWTAVVCGPGFARKLIHEVHVGTVDNDPLNVELSHGYRISGLVRDAQGNAIAGMQVSIKQWEFSGDMFLDLSRGDAKAITDKNGKFEFDDVTTVTPGAEIRVDVPPSMGAALPVELPANAAAIDFVVRGTGGVAGSVTGVGDGLSIVAIPWGSKYRGLTTDVDSKSSFRLDELPEGDYRLEVVRGARWQSSGPRIHVDAGRTVDVHIDL